MSSSEAPRSARSARSLPSRRAASPALLALAARGLLAALCLLAALRASAHADTGAALVSGRISARQLAVVRDALEDELRQAGWALRSLPGDETAAITACLGREAPWPCLTPLAQARGLARVIAIHVEREGPRGHRQLRLAGQLGHVATAALTVDARYCEPRGDLQLAAAARQLTRRLLAGGAVRGAATRIEVRTTPPGAVIRVDGRMVEAPDGSIAVTPGSHTVHLQLSGYRSELLTAIVEEGQRSYLDIELTPVPPRPPSPSPPPLPRDPPPSAETSSSTDEAPASSVEDFDPRVMPPFLDQADRRRRERPPSSPRWSPSSLSSPSSPSPPPPLVPGAAPRPPRPPAGDGRDHSLRKRAGWALTLGGAALLITGGVLLALDEDPAHGPAQLHRERYLDSAATGLGLSALGALSTATGLYLWITTPAADPSSTAGSLGGAGLGYAAEL